jgi:hypothetical protein
MRGVSLILVTYCKLDWPGLGVIYDILAYTATVLGLFGGLENPWARDKAIYS